MCVCLRARVFEVYVSVERWLLYSILQVVRYRANADCAHSCHRAHTNHCYHARSIVNTALFRSCYIEDVFTKNASKQTPAKEVQDKLCSIKVLKTRLQRPGSRFS